MINLQAIKAIYVFEMTRTFRTLLQSLVSPVISTSLYFIVFGTAIGSRMQDISDVPYGAFIVPGLIMLTVLTQSISNASFGSVTEVSDEKVCSNLVTGISCVVVPSTASSPFKVH